MNSMARRLYDASPPPLQSFLVSLEGLRTYRRKYGKTFRDAMEALEKNERLSLADLEKMQSARLQDLLTQAKATVPYYREHGGDPSDLSSWPILDKAVVADAPDRFLSEDRRFGRLYPQTSSGTTGTPLTIFCDSKAYQTEMAFRWRHRAWAGIAFGGRAAYVAGHPVIPRARTQPPFWALDRAENRMLFSSYHIGESTLPAYIAALERFQPALLHGYPSSLYLLATFAARAGSTIRPKAIITASETLLAHQREAIETAFQTKVFNWYGQTEMTCNVIECREGGLHARPDYGVLEVTDNGAMVCTALNNPAMPLIRYRTGDRLKLGPGACGCGCAFPLVESIEGRVEDYIITPEGYYVGRLDHVFKGAEGVREAQIVQTDRGTVVLRIVKADGYGPPMEARLREAAVERLGTAMKIRFEYPQSIERSPSGKFRFIVSHVAGPERTPR